jgi:hypothetical protein
MNRLSIDIGGRTRFEPGEEITVSAKWRLGRPPDAVELRIVWNTTGAEQCDLQVVETIRIESSMAEETRQLTVRLPREPYSFQGKKISLVWALELVALPSKASTRLEIEIGPGGKKVILPESPSRKKSRATSN